MSVHFDNTALGQLVIKGPATGVVNLTFPDMSGLANKLLALNSSGDFVFNDIPIAYSLPIASSTVLGGVKQGTGITISADGTISATGTSGVTTVSGRSGDVVLTASDISGLATVATTGHYSNISGTPVLATVATSGSYNDLSDKPANISVPTNVSAFVNDSNYQTGTQVTTTVNAAISAVVGAAPEAFDTLKEIADYLADQPTAEAITTAIEAKADKTYVDTELSSKVSSSALATVATTGNYADLLNPPDFATVATSGSYTDLINTPNLATVATTGSYTDLTDTPLNLSDFNNDTNYLTEIPIASSTVLGGVKQGDGLVISNDGTISVVQESGNGGVTPLLATLTTTNSTPVSLINFVLTDNSAMMFNAEIITRNSNSTKAAGYTIQGVVKRGVGAGTIAFTGSTMKSIVAEDISGLDANAAVNTSMGSLQINVIGDSSETLNWFGNVRAVYIK